MIPNAKALTDIVGLMTIRYAEVDYVLKTIKAVTNLSKQGFVSLDAPDPRGLYTVRKNFRGTVGTLYFRENKRLHFEVEQPYMEETEIKAFFTKRVERKQMLVYITAIPQPTLDMVKEVRLKGKTFTLSYQSNEVYSFEMEDPRIFAKDLYEWVGRKAFQFRLPKPIDEDGLFTIEEEKKEKLPTAAPPPPPEGALYSVIIEPYDGIVEFGKTIKFTAKPCDVKGNPVRDTQLTWSVGAGSNIGKIGPDGVFVPAVGSGTGMIVVTAVQRDRSTQGFATIRIVPPTQGTKPPSTGQTNLCSVCRKPLRYITQYMKWYCDTCQRYY
jgi:hypothetical protein